MIVKGKDVVGAGAVGALDYYIVRKQLKYSHAVSILTAVAAATIVVIAMNGVREKDPDFQEILLTPSKAHVGTGVAVLLPLFWNGPFQLFGRGVA